MSPSRVKYAKEKKTKNFLYVNGTSSLTAPVCSGRGRLREVVGYERVQYKALTEDIFGVFGKVVGYGGGRTRRFDCSA